MGMSKIRIVVDKNIQLKSWSVSNSEVLFRLTDKNRVLLQPWLEWVPEVKKAADSQKFIEKSRKEQTEETSLELGIWLDNELIGCIGFHGIKKDSRATSVGYWLDKDWQGKGIMSRSVKALIDYGFRELDLNRISIEAAVDNKKSWAIPERLGFLKEGVLREFRIIDGRPLDYRVYSLLKRDWKSTN